MGKRTAAAISHVAIGERARASRNSKHWRLKTRECGRTSPSSPEYPKAKVRSALTAIATLEKKQPDNPLPHDLRGAVLGAKGDKAVRARSFERALASIRPYFPRRREPCATRFGRQRSRTTRRRDSTRCWPRTRGTRRRFSPSRVYTPRRRIDRGGRGTDRQGRDGRANRRRTAAHADRVCSTKEPKKAVAAAQDALAALPDRADILDAAGKAYRAAGDTNQAIAIYRKFAQLRPESPLPYLRLAQLQVADKDSAGALAACKRRWRSSRISWRLGVESLR